MKHMVLVDSFICKTVGLYFAAQWCFLCSKFTSKLISIYQEIKQITLEEKGHDGKTVTKKARNLLNLYKENACPFADAKMELLEKEMEEAAKYLPKSEYHADHRHELSLVSEGTGGGPFICCDCNEQGSSWAYKMSGMRVRGAPQVAEAMNMTFDSNKKVLDIYPLAMTMSKSSKHHVFLMALAAGW
ncbi:hypothetical protein GOBAR_AA36661 [Gossypium barbadense]|uniref:Uncharacterized protein n=1 Tax=Gossypium barbadense TaxID=3634 RepID=A0A2P5VYY1_GOSBA|nr:hypothetical protein GOBAR_AA36661 [Gossypium barbadense]